MTSSSPNATDLSARSAASSAHYHPTSDTTDLTGIDATTIGASGTTGGYGKTVIADTGFGTATYGNTDISGYRSSNTDTYGGKRRTAGYDTESDTSNTFGGGNTFDISGLTTGTRGYTGSAYDAGRTSSSNSSSNNNVSSLRASKGGGGIGDGGSDTGFGYGNGWRNTFDVGNAGNTESTGYGSRADYRGR
ncbi:uncharacterized protein TRUGW13939_10642 [Talaromyces rugulosus]|uniref:Uncharacterized protein n=1 Tax=Talaromyces rugulosus TaxID=121627 RepID=A0A7H8RAP6_TALRU|nr:uncharacterized protein TRUGW13939_10642 [Talaromyces rugulosus]QKX63472.1 hypothetical protein TRUGW13939_10642 [Talaromyces rugulosus]